MSNPAWRAAAHGDQTAGAVSTPLRVAPWAVWSIAAVIVVSYFGLLGHFALAEPDEPRYAEIAREMLELRDWVTPHLNYVKYFEKPPLVYWLTALNFKLFGMSEFVARLWPALFAVVGILMTYALGRSMYGVWVGYVAAAVLASTPLYFGLGQIIILDMPLSALMTVALGAFWFAWKGTEHRRALVIVLYVATALAVLTKGPVAVVLIGATIVAFLLVRRCFGALRWLVSPIGLTVFVAIALPWFLLVSRRNPEFVEFFVVKQHLDRFLRPNEHQQPLWFFIPIIFGGMLPWTAFVLVAPRDIGRFVRWVATGRASPATLFCLLWAGVVFVFFSLSGSKLATYVLPVFCPLAILMARFFQEVITRRHARLLHRGFVVLLAFAVGSIVAAVISGVVVDNPIAALIVPRACAGAGVLLIGVAWALALVGRAALQPSLTVLLFTMLAVQAIAIDGRGVAAQYRPLGVALRRHAGADDLVVQYRHYVQGITFYARRRAIMVGSWGELDFGSRQGDQRAFFWKTDQQLIDAWRSPRHLFLVINRTELEPLRAQLQPPPREFAACGKKVVVVNFATAPAMPDSP